MSELPPDLDLKFLPDWLKEPAGTNPYANYAGETQGRGPRRDFDRGDRGGRSDRGRDQGRRPGPGGGGGQGRGPQGQSRPGQGARHGSGQGPAKRFNGPEGKGSGNRNAPHAPNTPRGDRRFDKPRQQSQEAAPAAPAPAAPSIPLQIDFIPELEGIAALSQQIKSNHRAYPLYSLGRMFLNKPERHRVRITSNAPACPIFQIGEGGPIFLNRAHAERDAFRTLKEDYYSEELIQNEPPRGNYTNVARCRFSGVLLGPTNHHGYQLALRRLYEARFSRRMDFNDFLRQIEVVNDPAAIEQWKTEASSTTVYRTLKEAEPVEFKTPQEVEAHFRANYLEKEVCGQKSVEISGLASRNLQDRIIRDAVRLAWEKERGFPAQIVNQIRPHFTEQGLHIWKHRKRILFVSTVRPVRFGPEARNISEHVAGILNVIEASPKCTRADISNHLLKPHEAEPEFQKLKGVLASDLHWLVASGHVIEFHDGTLDLPLMPKEIAAEASSGPAAVEAAAEGSTQATVEATTVEGGVESPAAPIQEPAEALPIGEAADAGSTVEPLVEAASEGETLPEQG